MRNKSQFGSPAHPTIKARGFIFAVFKGKNNLLPSEHGELEL